MRRRTLAGFLSVLVLAAAVLGLTLAQAPTTLRFVWFTDGPDLQAIEKLIREYNAKNPGTIVELSIVPFAQLDQLLTAQAAAGRAPDLARVTNPPRFYEHALDLRPHLSTPGFAAQFLDEPMKLMTGPAGEIYGVPHDFTLNGPFVNVSLFRKAGVALPTEACVSWERWATLARQVQTATGTPFAMAVDRSGHRLDGFLQTYGGGFFNADGSLRLNDPRTRQGIETFVRLHHEGVMPLEVWAGGTGGYAAANLFFINNQLPFYLSGNWQVAQFHSAIGDRFEWTAVLNGCAGGRYGGMPGGKFIMAFANTRAPAAATRLLEFLASKEAMSQFARDSSFLPTRKDLIAEGIQYPARSEVMNTFLKGITLLPQAAYTDTYNRFFGPVANEVRDRVTQAILKEISVDEAIARAERKAREITGQR